MEINDIKKALEGVVHPAFDKSIMELGLVEDINIKELPSGGYKVRFRLVFKAPDSSGSEIKEACTNAITKAYPGTEVSIMEMIGNNKPKQPSPAEKGWEQLADVKNVIAIESAKGGVGKSAVTVNLAITLARMGYKVGVADADLYGPSIPKMTGTEGAMPTAYTSETNGKPKDIIVPVEKFGVKWISLGYFAPADQAVIWRGPMASNALKQIVLDVKWDELDFLLLDMPPGTGDILISTVQDFPLKGAIIVTTPQPVAMADVEKGINMFLNKKINIPVLGIIENMSWFTPAELPENKYYIFGKDGGRELSEKYGIPLLGQIPLVQGIRESGDDGIPAAKNDGPVYDAFVKAAKQIIGQ
ncbi:MAG: Mrp/NBP35 family ATP-binding protein [Bacteroidales bacterium]|jgi:ATP-binding protein involved in chromosome partitioning|nr:Mrp/NBP35 family ATP-binding protein [Bacteroidales bacterium]